MTKKKQLRLETLKNSYLQREKEFDAAVDEAGRITDPEERILHLEKIRQDIKSEINNFKPPKGSEKSLYKFIDKLESNKVLYGVSVTSSWKKLRAEADYHLQRMNAQVKRVSGLMDESKRQQIDTAVKQADLITDPAEKILKLAEIRENTAGEQFWQISARIDTVVENNVQKLALSPLLGDVQEVRGIKEKFSEAAMQFIKDAAPETKQPKTGTSRNPDKRITPVIR